MTARRDAQGYLQGSQREHDTATPLFLTIDQGGHASRVLVFDHAGHQVVEARQTVEVSAPQPDWVEQDAEALVASVQSALVEAVQKLDARCQHIVAAGLVTQRSNIVCWDRRTGRALSPAISWQDRRAHHWLQNFEAHAEKIRRITGLLPSAHYGASKIHWCLEQLEEVAASRQQGTLACGPLASFLLFRLLKEQPLLVDSVNASRTLLWDRQTQRWSDELLNLFALDADYLPRCVPNQYAFGNLVFDEFFIPLSIPLTVCSGDQSAALFSLGMPKAGCAYLNMGTGAFLQCIEKNRDKTLPTRLLQSVVWHVPGELLQVVEATVNGAGSALAIVEKGLGIPSEQAQTEYAQWLATADNIPIYLNGVSGLGAPFWRPNFISRFVDDDAETAEPDAKLVAVMESILFLVQINLEEMSAEAVEVKQIMVSGGLSVLDGLCQRLADVTGLPVLRPSQSEATAKGLAFLLARIGSYVGDVDATWNTGNHKDHFTPAANSALLERYRRWRRALESELGEEVRGLGKENSEQAGNLIHE